MCVRACVRACVHACVSACAFKLVHVCMYIYVCSRRTCPACTNDEACEVDVAGLVKWPVVNRLFSIVL